MAKFIWIFILLAVAVSACPGFLLIFFGSLAIVLAIAGAIRWAFSSLIGEPIGERHAPEQSPESQPSPEPDLWLLAETYCQAHNLELIELKGDIITIFDPSLMTRIEARIAATPGGIIFKKLIKRTPVLY